MPIVGFNFNNIQAQKTKNLDSLKKDEQVKIDSKLGIKEVKEEKLPTGKTKTDGLKFDFELSLDYQPGVAKIVIGGFIYYMDDSNIIKEILETWKKKKDVPINIKTDVLNTVLLKATIKAFQLEQEINIPPHMPFPAIKPASEKGKGEYIG